MSSLGSLGNVRSSSDIAESETQSRKIQDHVNQFEHDFGTLSLEFVAYTRRSAKLRDNGDEMAKILNNYSTMLRYNESMKTSLTKFSEQLASVEDHRHAEVERLVGKVVKPLSEFGNDCKLIKSQIRDTSSALKKESTKVKKLQKSPSKPISTNSLKASQDSISKEHQLHSQIIAFEKKKLENTKQILSDFVQIEMMWHIKALELFSEAFGVIQNIDCDRDLETFRQSLHLDGQNNNLSTMRQRSSSQGSLNSLAGRPPPLPPPNTLPRSNAGQQSSNVTPNPTLRSTNSLKVSSSNKPNGPSSAAVNAKSRQPRAAGDNGMHSSEDFTDDDDDDEEEEEEEEEDDDEEGDEDDEDEEEDDDDDEYTDESTEISAPQPKNASKSSADFNKKISSGSRK